MRVMNVSIVIKMLVMDALPEDMSESKMFICEMKVVKSGCKVLVFLIIWAYIGEFVWVF